MNNFKEGDQVIWTYKHWIRGETYVLRYKQGAFLRIVEAKSGPQKALVKFPWNKNDSTVLIDDLQKYEGQKTF